MINHKLSDKLLIVFFLFLSIFPFGLGCICAINYYLNYHYFKIEFLIIFLIYIVILLLIFKKQIIIKISKIEIISIIVLLTIITRWLVMILINTQPTSDFQNAFISAGNHINGPYKDLYSARFPYWGFFILTLSLIFKIFGYSLIIMKIFNLCIAGATVIGIYLLSKEIINSEKFSLIAALIYVFLPADIFYKNLPTGEHIFTMLLPYTCIIFLKAIKLKNNKFNKNIFLLLFTGLLLGLMDMYKPVAIILFISFSITIFYLKIIPNNISNNNYRHKNIIKLIFIFILIISYWTTKEAGYLILQYETNYPPNKYGFISTLRVGLDPKINGRFDKSIAIHIKDLMTENNENYNLVNSLLNIEIKDIIFSNNINTYINLFKYKFYHVWSTEWAFYNWPTQKQIDNNLTMYDPIKLGNYVKPWNDSYLIFMLYFSAIGALYCSIYHRNEASLSIGLFIFGFSLLLLFTEVQQRYRSVLFSSIPIFMALGVYATSQIISKLYSKYLLKIKIIE